MCRYLGRTDHRLTHGTVDQKSLIKSNKGNEWSMEVRAPWQNRCISGSCRLRVRTGMTVPGQLPHLPRRSQSPAPAAAPFHLHGSHGHVLHMQGKDWATATPSMLQPITNLQLFHFNRMAARGMLCRRVGESFLTGFVGSIE